ncbi:hypothetical protein Tco_0156497 [Tanacetum coccineum]
MLRTEILHDVVGTSGYHCEVLRSFPVERIEQGIGYPRGIFINQSKYALEKLKKYGFDKCDVVDIPKVGQSKLDEDLNGTPVDPTRYRGMVRSIMYLTASHPNLVFAVCMYARYQTKPTEKHLTAIKRVFRYLKGTINMGLWYPKDTGFNLTAFAGADHAGCQDSKKSTSGSAQFLGEKLLTDYRFDFNKIPLYFDSKSATALSCNTVQHSRTKHIAVRYHFIKEQVENEVVEMYFIKTDYQLPDIFTKALARKRFRIPDQTPWYAKHRTGRAEMSCRVRRRVILHLFFVLYVS